MWIPILLAIASFAYSYYMMRKMQKQNRPDANSQLDGSIVDEGRSFSDIAGSPHLHPFITWMGNKSTQDIKKKGGKK